MIVRSHLLLFVVLRLLDVISTHLSVARHGLGVEANPLMRSLLSSGGGYFILFQVAVSAAIIYGAWRFRSHRIVRVVLPVLNIVTMAVVLSNFGSYIIAVKGWHL